jgi:hypothetical protein
MHEEVKDIDRLAEFTRHEELQLLPHVRLRLERGKAKRRREQDECE